MRSSRQVVEHAISRAKDGRGATWEFATRHHRLRDEQWPEDVESSSPTTQKTPVRAKISK